MSSIREQILAALLARLETVPGATVKREAPLPETVPAGGLIILRDGDPGDPEVVLSPVTYHREHLPEIEVMEEEVPDVSLIGKKLLRDNQGFGKYRGGTGFQWAISPKDSPLWGFGAVASGSSYPSISAKK